MTLLRLITLLAASALCFASAFGQSLMPLPGKAKDIDAGAYNSVWRIGADSSIARFEENGWTKIDGTAERVAVDSFGFPWVVKSTGEILRRNGRTWITLPGKAVDIDIGANGDVWIAGKDGWVRKWNGTDWADAVKLDAVRIAVDPLGIPWAINSKGEIVSTDPARTKFSGTAKSLATGTDAIAFWIVSPDHSIARWTAESKWKQELKGEFAEISIAPDGSVYMIDTKGDMFRSTPK